MKKKVTREELKQMIINGEDVTNIDTAGITDMSWLFYNATSFNQDISKWNVSNVTNMSFMFSNAEKFNQDISNWDVSSVEDMYSMFYKASSFNQDISKWDISNVEFIYSMFELASSFNQLNISKWSNKNKAVDLSIFKGTKLENNEKFKNLIMLHTAINEL